MRAAPALQEVHFHGDLIEAKGGDGPCDPLKSLVDYQTQVMPRVAKSAAKSRLGNLRFRRYDSRAEADYRQLLETRLQFGEIRDIEEQPRIELERGIFYRPDFTFFEIRTERQIWVEVKGVETDRFRFITKIWRLHGPGLLQVVRRRGRESPFRITKQIFPDLGYE